MLEKARAGSWIFVDEVQRLPNLLNEVHRFIESKKLKFILTGSSARKLKRGGTNLLGGRALLKELHPLLPKELGSDFNLDDALGQRDASVDRDDDARRAKLRLKSYVQTYLKEEIQAEALVRNLAGFTLLASRRASKWTDN